MSLQAPGQNTTTWSSEPASANLTQAEPQDESHNGYKHQINSIYSLGCLDRYALARLQLEL